ncbi:MAG: choice-of-anchor D domain-containing protein, partial [Rhizobacter sp.]|nr:choice-of-anchor D domain-containing protein [Ferruginibacter sp.]
MKITPVFSKKLSCHGKLVIFACLLFTGFKSWAQTGEVLDFDGSTNSVTLAFSLSGSYTKEAWIKPASTANFPNIISGNNTAFYIENGKLTAGHAGTFAYKEVQDTENMLSGTWYHIAVSYDAALSEMKLYKNGTLVASNPGASAYTENFLFLGLFSNGNRFTGQMDEVRIWKTARTEIEINASKDCELTGDEPGLLLYYNFNQGIAGGNNTAITLLNDSQDKCNAVNGTLTNFTLTGSSSNFVAPGPPLAVACGNQFPNINITGNSLCIVAGDNTPGPADNTSYGNFTSMPVVKTYTIQNTGNGNLNISSIQITGTNAADFIVSAAPAPVIAGGASSSFSISFNPAGAVGIKTAVIQVNSDDGDELVYTFSVDGIKSPPAKSLDFDGVNDEVALPFIITGDYTKEAWIKTNTLSGFPNILSGTGTALFLNNGRVAAGHVNGGFGQALSTTVLTTNQWHHVAVTYNATTLDMKLYLNGALLVTAAGVPAYTETILKIGSLNSSNFFWGRIDQVRIWEEVRTGTEIQNSYQCNISGDEPGLLAWYNFNQGAGEGNNAGISTAINDVDNCTASAYNGTLNNFALTGPNSNWVFESNNILNSCAAVFPNIKIEGNNNCISDGDNSPSVTDNTDFGNVTGAGAAKTFVIHNTGTATLNIGAISFIGADDEMFTLDTLVPATLPPGASANIAVNFLPVGNGLKTASIIVNNDDTDEAAYTFSLQGTGITAAISITNIVVTPNANGTSIITWTTDVPASSVVDYGIAPGSLGLNSSDASLVTNHIIQLSGLTAGVSYYFRVTSVDAGSNTVTFPNPPATPLSFSMPPAITEQPLTQTICEGSSVTFSSAATSDVASTVQWQISTDNGGSWEDSTGATAASITFIVSDADDGKQFRTLWTNVGGADTSAAAILTVNDTTWGAENVVVCNNLLPYTWNGNEYTASGSYPINLAGANVNGCDSVAVLNLIVKDSSFSITNISICNNLLPYNWNGVDYTTSGSYTIVLPAANVNDCDSTATLNLTIKDTSFSVTNISICNNLLPYNWNGIDYTTSGSYTIILPAANVNDCDSTATLNLTIKDTSFSVTNISICNNLLPYNWNGIDYTTSGSYTIVLPAANVNDCDSTATLNLTVKDTSFSITDISICNN